MGTWEHRKLKPSPRTHTHTLFTKKMFPHVDMSQGLVSMSRYVSHHPTRKGISFPTDTCFGDVRQIPKVGRLYQAVCHPTSHLVHAKNHIVIPSTPRQWAIGNLHSHHIWKDRRLQLTLAPRNQQAEHHEPTQPEKSEGSPDPPTSAVRQQVEGGCSSPQFVALVSQLIKVEIYWNPISYTHCFHPNCIPKEYCWSYITWCSHDIPTKNGYHPYCYQSFH